MTQILNTTIEASLPQLVDIYSQPEFRHHQVELWVFNDKSSRDKAQDQLIAAGVKAKVRSAYKPLLHAVIEEMDITQAELERLDIYYPVNDYCQPSRFILETYPLSAIMGVDKVKFIENRSRSLTYKVYADLKNGETTSCSVLAPSVVKNSVTSDRHLSPTGWVRVTDPHGKLYIDKRVDTDYEQVFDSIMNAVSHYPWHDLPFQQLNIWVKGPMFDQKLSYAHEHISLSEALHEDLYFSIQEWFKYQAGKAPHDRSFKFGQVIPDICSDQGDYKVWVQLSPYILTDRDLPNQQLANAGYPLSSAQVLSELAEIEGIRLEALSVAGRELGAVYHNGTDQAVLISGGQHANEASGVVGALRAAQQLALQPESHFVISPLENPDGYETFLRLLETNPSHMHHAARYTALGNDLDTHNGDRPYENAIRLRSLALGNVKFHINLHGYPSHEWVRPFSGYIPKGFEKWTIPKGFFLILRYSDDNLYQTYGRELLWRLTERLNDIPDLGEFNRSQRDLFSIHVGSNDTKLLNNIPCIVTKVASSNVPLQLISEFPDETISGSHFEFAHTVQKAVVVEAYNIYQSLVAVSSRAG